MTHDLEHHRYTYELRRIIFKLDMVSHVSAGPLGSSVSSTAESKGGRRPAGGIDWQGDREPGFRQKSAAYFRRRWHHVTTLQGLLELLTEAREALDAWQRTPVMALIEEPERDSFQWKCMVADDTNGSDQDIWMRHSISRRTLYNYRAKYRGLRNRENRLQSE